MFSETRYARYGDLRVAYRASREGARDIVIVPTWLTCCERSCKLRGRAGGSGVFADLERLADRVAITRYAAVRQWDTQQICAGKCCAR